MKPLLILTFLAGTASPACVPVATSRITGRDLALADPRFAALPSTLVAGFNAEPGKSRIFTGSELQRLAKTNGLVIDQPSDLCFQFPINQLTAENAIAAMRRVLPTEATLDLLEIQSTPVPEGVLEFPLAGLEPGGTWRGYVKFAESSKAPVWARVSVTVPYSAVIAATDLPADMPIPASAVRLEQRTGPLQHESAATRIADVVGRAPGRTLKAGALIPVNLLTDPPAVHRGDPVRVEVRSGAARLHFDAIAEAPAGKGAMVELRNPLNGKTFKARLDSPTTATLEVAGGHSL
jgi:flagella basal body P-ring formation protein FlgA